MGAKTDKIKAVSRIQITSTQPPFDTPAIAARAARLLACADAMGLLADLAINRLDLPLLRTVVDRLAAAGIGQEMQAALAVPRTVPDLNTLLSRLNQALAESPAPAYEWAALSALFDSESLAALLGVSSASLHRYRAGVRKTPDRVADRLHFLALLVGELAGAYNEIGIRRWFYRPRQLLAGATPADLLQGDWSPAEPGPQRVRALAESLNGAGAT